MDLATVKNEASVEAGAAKEILTFLEKEFEIENVSDQAYAGNLLIEVKGLYKRIDERRKKITSPLNAALREVNDLFRPALQYYEQCERVLKSRIAGYLEAQQTANAEALRQAAATEDPDVAADALAVIERPVPPEGVSVRHVWKFEVVDSEKVPREFCSPDHAKISNAFAAGVEVPGVRYYQEAIVAARKG